MLPCWEMSSHEEPGQRTAPDWGQCSEPLSSEVSSMMKKCKTLVLVNPCVLCWFKEKEKRIEILQFGCDFSFTHTVFSSQKFIQVEDSYVFPPPWLIKHQPPHCQTEQVKRSCFMKIIWESSKKCHLRYLDSWAQQLSKPLIHHTRLRITKEPLASMAPGLLRENVCPTAASSQRGNLASSGPQLPAEQSAPGMVGLCTSIIAFLVMMSMVK